MKNRAPETVIVFGDPQVPDLVEGFLRENAFVDIACHGEGEQAALGILENFASKNWSVVPSISYIDHNSKIATNTKASRMNDLSTVPSPYLDGIFAPLMEANLDATWMALWETNRGCPFSCTFCDWGSATQAKVYGFDIERLNKEVDWFAQNQIEFVFCCDANFGLLPRDIDIASHVAETKQKHDYPRSLSVFNTKNASERAFTVQKILSDAGLHRGVDSALQSMDTDTLKAIKRTNISIDTFQELQSRFTQNGVRTYSEVILGLPGETYESFANGFPTIIERGQHNKIRNGILAILPNAEMGDPEYQRKYGMVTVESKINNDHATVYEKKEVDEFQTLVIATDSMPIDDWVKTKVFAWMAGLLHFSKAIQIPFVLIHEISGTSYRELIERFTEGPLESFPILSGIRSMFVDQAKGIQGGGPEGIAPEEWLNLWWPADEYQLIKLCVEDTLQQFYDEAESLLNSSVTDKDHLPLGPLHESMELNRKLLKQPFQTEYFDIESSYNIWDCYQSVMDGNNIPLVKGEYKYRVDPSVTSWPSWEDWCREVIWYGNSSGAYLYGKDVVTIKETQGSKPA